MDESLRLGLLACVDQTPGCSGAAQAYFDFLTANILVNDPAGARTLIIQGGLDNVMPPAEEAACVTDKLRADGVPLDVCVDSGAINTNVIDRNRAFAVGWVEAVLQQGQPPACPSTAALPSCVP